MWICCKNVPCLVQLSTVCFFLLLNMICGVVLPDIIHQILTPDSPSVGALRLANVLLEGRTAGVQVDRKNNSIVPREAGKSMNDHKMLSISCLTPSTMIFISWQDRPSCVCCGLSGLFQPGGGCGRCQWKENIPPWTKVTFSSTSEHFKSLKQRRHLQLTLYLFQFYNSNCFHKFYAVAIIT